MELGLGVGLGPQGFSAQECCVTRVVTRVVCDQIRDTILLHGGGDKHAIQEHCDQIREAIATTTSDYDR